MKKKCEWGLGTDCRGKIKDINIFGADGIILSICERHFTEHKIIMTLGAAGYDPDETLEQTAKWRQAEYDKVVKSGQIDPDKVVI